MKSHFDRVLDGHFDADFFPQLPRERVARILARLDLASGKFPCARQMRAFFALGEQDAPAFDEHSRRDDHWKSLLNRLDHGSARQT